MRDFGLVFWIRRSVGAVLWWLMSYDNAIVITTAPSDRQVREILWRDLLRNLYMPIRDLIGGKLTRTRLNFSATRYAYGFSTNTEDRFQGFHSGNILVIVDEASGVDEFIYQAIRGVLTTSNAKLLMIGNPHGLAGTVYDAFHKNRKQYKTIHITAFDSPAFKAASITEKNIQDVEYPDPISDDTDVIPAHNTVIPAGPAPYSDTGAGTQGNINDADPHIPICLSTPRWAINLFNSYGPKSPVYQTRVLGQFPEESRRHSDTPGKQSNARPKSQPETKPVTGVDIARFGNDKTVIVIRDGTRIIYIEEIRKSDLVNTTGRVVVAAQKHNVRNIIIDEVGVVAGVLDTLKEDRRFNAKGLNGGNRADNPAKYLNTRAQIFDGLRQRFADGDVSIPNDPELISQLASLTYRYNARGQLQLESKDQIRSHGRQSPDKADALAYACAETLKTKLQRRHKGSHTHHHRKTPKSQDVGPQIPRLNRPRQRTTTTATPSTTKTQSQESHPKFHPLSPLPLGGRGLG